MNQTAPLLDTSVVHDPTLSLFQKVLLVTDGTVTQLVELYTGESICVKKIENQIVTNNIIPADVQRILQTTDSNAVLKRIILLCGSKSYIYAESYFVMERLPQDMRIKLETTNIPIGLLWREVRLETHREIIEYRRECDAAVAGHLGINAESELLSRTYMLYTNGKPMGVITEKFPARYFL